MKFGEVWPIFELQSSENFTCNLSQILQLKRAEFKVHFENVVFRNVIAYIVKVLSGKGSCSPDSSVCVYIYTCNFMTL